MSSAQNYGAVQNKPVTSHRMPNRTEGMLLVSSWGPAHEGGDYDSIWTWNTGFISFLLHMAQFNFPYSVWHYLLLLALLALIWYRKQNPRNNACWMKGIRKVGDKETVILFSAAVHGFLISSEITEHDELSGVVNPSMQVSPTLPTLRWSSMNSPYCCLMETSTQTNAQPLPGSAPRLLINPDAETLMALIFQTKRCLLLTLLCNKRESASEAQPKGKRVPCSPPTAHLPLWKHKVLQTWGVSASVEAETKVQITFETKALIFRVTLFFIQGEEGCSGANQNYIVGKHNFGNGLLGWLKLLNRLVDMRFLPSRENAPGPEGFPRGSLVQCVETQGSQGQRFYLGLTFGSNKLMLLVCETKTLNLTPLSSTREGKLFNRTRLRVSRTKHLT